MQDISKDELLLLLKENGAQETEVFEDSDITKEIILSRLSKEKIQVPEAFYSSLADRLGLQFMSDVDLLSRVDAGCVLPYTIEEEGQILLLESKPKYIQVATSNPLYSPIFANLAEVFHKTVERVVVSAYALETVSDTCYQKPHSYSAMRELVDRQPDESAYKVLLPWQKTTIIIITILLALLFIINPYYTGFLFFTLINISYFLVNPVKFYISLQGFVGTKNVIYVSEDELKEIKDEELPIYTILVPLYREADMLPHVMRNIYSLDYPHDKLDVKILMEEDDTDTQEKARKLGLFGHVEEIIAPMTLEGHRQFLSIFHPVIVPNAEVKTKPRATNYGLKRAHGEFVVIYDAEDLPDRDQLKKAVIAFRKVGPEYVCIQCLLNFFNPRENMLTRWFTVEYSYYYDYYIQGLDKINAPIPLGGTSNHFRIKTLRELGAWDPFNVTEDADLGMRIARKKYRTGVLNSHTYEEATSNVGIWIKQRSRWVKGFVITWLVTMRHPIRVFKDIGLRNYIIFHLGFGGNFYLPMMNVILWLVLIISLIFPGWFSSWFDFWPFAVIAVFNLLVGNLSYLTLMMLATYQEKQYDLLLYSFFSPVYWVLMSIGAWKGFFQLVSNPHKWEKTTHGQTLTHAKVETREPEQVAKEIKQIEVNPPDFIPGKTDITVPQLAFSVGFTIVLVLFGLIIFGFINYPPISKHFTIERVPGLSQALAPYYDIKAGREPNLLNYEAIPKPYQRIDPNITVSLPPEPRRPIERIAKTLKSEVEPWVMLQYDPMVNSIIIHLQDQPAKGSWYEVSVRYPENRNEVRVIRKGPIREIFPGGDGQSAVNVTKIYRSGMRVKILNEMV